MLPIASNEADRLAAPPGVAIVDRPDDGHFGAVCRLARDVFSVPIALVSFDEETRQWFGAKCGTSDGVDRGTAFCSSTILRDDVFVVEDATTDARFAANAMVHGEQGIRFYAGALLTLRPDIHVGAFCIKDTKPRTFSQKQIRQLRDFAEIIVTQLRLHEAECARESEGHALLAVRDAQRVAEQTASFGHWLIDPVARTVAWSDGIASIFGAPMPESGKLDIEAHLLFYHPDERDIIRRRIEEVIAGTDCKTYDGHRSQGRVIRPDGEQRIVTVRSVPIRDETGRAKAIYGVLLDVTDQVQAEERLRANEVAIRESEARYRLLADAASDMVIRCTIDDVITYVSPASRELLGYSPDEMMRLPFSESTHPDDRQRTRDFMLALKSGCVEHDRITHRLLHRDGHWVWVEARFCLMRGDEGSPVEVIAAMRDVSERKAVEDALRESEARYRALADALPQIVWVMKAQDGEAIYVNRQFSAYYGPIGTSAAARVARNHPGDAEQMQAGWRAVADGRPFQLEARLQRHDGEYRWHKLVMIPVRRGGEIVEWIGTALDIHEIVEARAKLEQTTNLLRLAQEAAGAGVWEWDIPSGLIRQSINSARMHGLAVEDCADPDARVESPVQKLESCIHSDDFRHVHAEVMRAIDQRTTYNAEYRIRRSDGEGAGFRWVQSFGRVIFDTESNEPLRLVGLNLDVTERKQADAALRLSEERLALALDSGSDGLWDWNVATGAINVSGQYLHTLGYALGEIEPSIEAWSKLVHPEDAESVSRLKKAHLKGRTPLYECEYRIKTKGGAYRWTLARGKAVARDEAGRGLRMVGTYIDITSRKEAEQQVAHMAAHDALTSLPNRLLFRDRLNHELANAKRHGGSFAVLACDLDRFKAVNDTFGHPAGDKLLRTIAERLTSVVRDVDTVARLGGDEFAIILSWLDAPQAASLTAGRVIEVVGQPVELDGAVASIGVSIGIALGTADCADADNLFKNADIALYRAKAAGRNTFSFYEPGMDAVVASRNFLERDLREAIGNGGFLLHYQPIMNLAGAAPAGFEALIRWKHPERGMVSPAEFIPLAEESGLIVPLGDWVLREACREAAGWPGDLRVAVNVSAVQFQKPGLEQAVIGALVASGLAPHRLELEITESVLIEDSEAAIACLHRLRALGVRIALDDFGTGYSSLSYLRRFPFDKIKIDRSFVRDIADPDAAAIVRAIVSIGERLGTAVTAEGVETGEQLERIRQEGCTEVQGFLYSRPLPAADTLAFACVRDSRVAA